MPSHRLSVGRQPLWPQPFAMRRRRTASCRAPRAACTHWEQVQALSGSDSGRGPVRSTPCCGRPAFTTSPARWEPISMRSQFRQLCDGPRTVYLAFDADANGSGQQAAQCLSRQSPGARHALRSSGLTARRPRSQQLLRPGRRCRISFSACWRRLCHEIPRDSTASRSRKRPQPVSRSFKHNGGEVEWVNHFLDQQRVRGVAETTLRSYAYDLLHFLRWWATVKHSTAITEKDPDRIHLARLYSLPGEPAATTRRRQHQSQRGNRRAGTTS